MKVVTPATIDATRLVSSNVTESILDYDETKSYGIGDFVVFGQKLYQSAVGMDVSSIPDFDAAKPYIVGDKVKVKADNKVYAAIAGGIANDFAEWSAVDGEGNPKAYYNGQYCKIVSRGKIYIAKNGEDPSQHDEWSETETYASGATVKVTPVYDLKKGNALNQVRVYKSRKADNLNKPPASNLTGSTPWWELVGICNVNSPPDTSVLYTEWASATAYVSGDVCKVTSASAAFVALKDNTNKPPASNLIGSDPAWKRLEGFTINQQDDNYLWEEFDVLNVGIVPSEDVALSSPKAWKVFGVYNIDLQPDENIYVAATSDSEAVGAWYEIGYTNKWRMFDNSVSTVTSRAELIDVTLDWTWCDTVALFNLEALSVQLDLTVEGVSIYSETVSTFVDDYTSWADVFFNDPQFVGNVYRVIAPSLGAKLRVRISAPNGTAKCGHLVIGMGKHIGKSRYGLEAGIADYSKITTDDYGNTTLSQGNYAVTADLDLWVNKGMRPAVRKFLEARRATPLVWHMDNNDSSPAYDLVLFGFYKEFTTTIEARNQDGCSISITGLA